jgi:hypothetical protein
MHIFSVLQGYEIEDLNGTSFYTSYTQNPGSSLQQVFEECPDTGITMLLVDPEMEAHL